MKEGALIHTKSLLFLLISTSFLASHVNITNETKHEYKYQTNVSFCFDDNETPTPNNAISCHVLRVVNGDTFIAEINGIEERVRLIGIDTPETIFPNSSKNNTKGELASAYIKDLLEGKEVFLESDIQERDKYNRILAYAYLDGIMVNRYLLQKGYATLSTNPPNIKYLNSFKETMTIFQQKNLPSPYEKNNLAK